MKGRTVLEYGCGNGPVTAAFAPLAARYIGVDIDEAAVGDTRRILGEGSVHPELHVVPPDERSSPRRPPSAARSTSSCAMRCWST